VQRRLRHRIASHRIASHRIAQRSAAQRSAEQHSAAQHDDVCSAACDAFIASSIGEPHAPACGVPQTESRCSEPGAIERRGASPPGAALLAPGPDCSAPWCVCMRTALPRFCSFALFSPAVGVKKCSTWSSPLRAFSIEPELPHALAPESRPGFLPRALLSPEWHASLLDPVFAGGVKKCSSERLPSDCSRLQQRRAEASVSCDEQAAGARGVGTLQGSDARAGGTRSSRG
jgi:hypothetical protein